MKKIARVLSALIPLLRVRAGISCTILLAIAGALLRCAPLAVPALRRVAHLASPPAMAAKWHNLFLRGPLTLAVGVFAREPVPMQPIKLELNKL